MLTENREKAASWRALLQHYTANLMVPDGPEGGFIRTHKTKMSEGDCTKFQMIFEVSGPGSEEYSFG